MKASFKPRARLLKLLGDQLIGTPQLAIFELVKNSYDADADKVEVTIRKPLNLEEGSIEVTDFGGEGMDADTIKNIWLEPGADHKEHKRKSGKRTTKHNRLPLGEKGVGRFAVHKLGQKIKLVTKTKSTPEVELNIDWRAFEKVKYIEDQEVEIKTNTTPSVFKDGRTGTQIIISELNNPLSDASIRELYRNIQSIRSPFEHNSIENRLKDCKKGADDEKPNFEVTLHLPDNPNLTDDLLDLADMIKQAMFKFSFIVDESGKWQWLYEFSPNEQIQKSFKVIPKTEKSNGIEFLPFAHNEDKEFKKAYYENPSQILEGIGPIKGEFYVFDFDKDVLGHYHNTDSLRKFVRQNGGIRIYRDDIRVYNYGEPSDDWLSLDDRRVQSVAKGLNRKITVGAVSLELLPDSRLTEKTNREGFIENEAFELLHKIVTNCIGKFESLRKPDKDRLRELLKGETTSSVIEIKKPVDSLREIAEKKGILKELAPTIDRIEKSYEEMRDVMLKAGTAGLNMTIAFHEIHRGVRDARKIIEKGEAREVLIKQLERFELLLDTYANLIKQERPKQTTLKEVLQNNHAISELRFEMHDVLVSCPILADDEPNYSLKLPTQLITSAINNLVDNSIHWLDQRWGAEKDKKYLYIGVNEEFGLGPAIIVADNGPGWRNITPEDMVKPFMTTKSGGMGIGLFYTANIMEQIGGELVFLKPGDIEGIPDAANGAIIALVFNGGEPCRN